MPQETATRTARLEARITREALAVVRRAAEIQGRSISDFVVAAAQEAAVKTVTEVEVIRLSREAQEKFAALLLHPPALAPALKKAFERRRKLIVE
jgi:uncharacterized protein (DUF1778 family)